MARPGLWLCGIGALLLAQSALAAPSSIATVVLKPTVNSMGIWVTTSGDDSDAGSGSVDGGCGCGTSGQGGSAAPLLLAGLLLLRARRLHG